MLLFRYMAYIALQMIFQNLVHILMDNHQIQNELDAQEDLIDYVDAAVQRTDIKTKKINKQMNNLLKDDSAKPDSVLENKQI